MRLLADAGDELGAHTYPATTDELIDEYGDMELELPNGSERLGEALGRLESETLESAEEARLTAYSAVSSKAIGRKGYSDRDPVSLGEDGPDQMSF
jgi:hypothetical protein